MTLEEERHCKDELQVRQRHWDVLITVVTNDRLIAEWEARGEAEMGVSFIRKIAQRHNAGVSRRLRAKHNRQASIDLRLIQPGSEGENETNRLS